MTTYTEEMWSRYLELVKKMWSQGYEIPEIARVVESSEEVVKAVVEKYCPGIARN